MAPRRRKPPGDRGGGGSKPGPRPNPDNRDGKKGGKKGDSKKGGKKQPRRKNNRSDLYDRALRDIEFGIDPLLDEIRRAGEMAGDDYKKSSQRVNDIYGGLLNQLAPLTAQHTQNVGSFGNDLSAQIGGLAGMLGSNVPGVPQSEITAGTGVVGSIGAGGLAQLASDRARNSAYNTSAIRQGGIEQATTTRNYLQDYQNFLDDLAQRRQDIKADMPLMLRTRLDELRDQQFQQNMARKEFGLRAAAAEAQGANSKAIAGLVKDWANPNQGPNNGPGGPGPGPGGPGPGGNNGGWRPVGNKVPAGGGRSFQDLLAGRSTMRELQPGQRSALRGYITQRPGQVWPPLMSEYQRLFNRLPQADTTPEYIKLLKQVARKKSRLASDPTPGPGPGR